MRSCTRAWARRFAAVECAYLIVLSAFTGCKGEPASARGARFGSADVTVFLIGPGGSCPMWPAIEGGARRYVRGIPYLSVVALEPGDATAEALNATVSEVLGKQPGAICLYVQDPAVARSAATRIVRRDVLLVTMGERIDDVQVTGHVQPTFAYGAEMLGDALVDLAGGKRSYVLLHEQGRTALATECYTRFKAKADRQYTLTLLEQRSTYGCDSSPRQLIKEMLQTFRHAGLVVTLTPEPWLSGAADTVLHDENRFATLGAVPQLWPYLRSGRAAALVGPLDGEIGYAALGLVLDALTETENGASGTERMVLTEIVTEKTLDDFARRYAAAAGMELSTLLSGSASTTLPVATDGE